MVCQAEFGTYPSENAKLCSTTCKIKAESNRRMNLPPTSTKYSAVHRWIERHFGKPDTCEHCYRNGLTRQKIQWANRTGKYLHDREDWLRLCRKCHYKYDIDIHRKAIAKRDARLKDVKLRRTQNA